MGVGEPCGLEGTNIINSGNGTTAWLDATGVLHEYPSEPILQATQKNGGCPSGETRLSTEVYSTMTKGVRYEFNI